MKTRIHAAPAVKGLKTTIVVISKGYSVMTPAATETVTSSSGAQRMGRGNLVERLTAAS